ncbi:MAG: arginine deiminase [Gammaproteobacteria bacterium]|nr:arginine deiminase [Gammaproteobacteria bacterium]
MKIHSEIAPLKKVILHRPNLSLKHLTPKNCQTFLFDDVLWVEKANEEHRFFTDQLKSHGVEVYLLHDLMTETLMEASAREWLITRTLTSLDYPQEPYAALNAYLHQLDNRALTTYLLGGLALGEIDDKGLKNNLAPYSKQDDFILPPLPNHLFTRDTSCWIDNGVSINPMHFPARQRETLNMAAVYKFHPLFQAADFHVWYDGSDETQSLPSLEGGDVLVLSKECVLIGLSQRTTFQAVTLLAKTLFRHSTIRHVLTVDIPKARASMHLDTVMTMADVATFCLAFPPDQHLFRAWSIRPGNDESALNINQEEDFFQALAHALGETSLNLIIPTSDRFTSEREQWNDACNLLAIAPGKVVVYDRNSEMNQQLRQEGLELIEIPGAELSRGRGGSRCMSCPIERE